MQDLLEAIAIAIVVSIILIIFVVQAFYIPSESMEPTLKPGDRILVNKFIYNFRDPKRQEIIVFNYPLEPDRKFVKRVIATPGDRVKIKEGKVFVNGEQLKEEYVVEDSYTDFAEVKVPENNYFVLGDNRNNSKDSRYWGFVPEDNIVGHPFIIFWPLNRIKIIGGDIHVDSMVSRTYGQS
ncbi:signal peptidase I [Halanaerobacter jeridensis]|uniref:Signal peptidase I n=1 Tax=Halanaerobacter jeridensis TaxID=706427 RepID=A0A939BQV7_9FIRM|nr:signal peptidase I [Halanaerobacter jeridensis]MBM7555321.1 signal peptidase I [Halanaerobacter jeridensis]